jgi:flagellar biogenesis protein FliO
MLHEGMSSSNAAAEAEAAAWSKHSVVMNAMLAFAGACCWAVRLMQMCVPV